MSSRCASGSKSLRLTVHGGASPNACCSKEVSRMVGLPHSLALPEPGAVLAAVNRDRGASHDATPPTPPGIRVRTTAVRRIASPSPQQRVQVGNHPLQGHPAMPTGQLAHPVLEPGDGLVGNASPRLRFVRDREAKERPLPRPGDGTLLRIDLKLEASLDEAGQTGHDPVAGLFAADIDVAVVRVTDEAVAKTLKFAI